MTYLEESLWIQGPSFLKDKNVTFHLDIDAESCNADLDGGAEVRPGVRVMTTQTERSITPSSEMFFFLSGSKSVHSLSQVP